MANELINIDTGAALVGGAAYVAKDFFKVLMKTPIEELGGMIADRIKEHRAFLQLKGLTRIKEKCKSEGVNPKEINMKVLYPYLESISIEEEEPLQAAWTNLMVNYVDPEKNLDVIVFPGILKDLSTSEIEILNAMEPVEGRKFGFTYEVTHSSFPKEACLNLERLGLIKEIMVDKNRPTAHSNLIGPMETEIKGSGRYVTTEFAKVFIAACRR